jgi:hypothetical protein
MSLLELQGFGFDVGLLPSERHHERTVPEDGPGTERAASKDNPS